MLAQAKLRYLENDYTAKLAWTVHLLCKGHLDILGIEREAFKVFDIKQGSFEYELSRSLEWDKGSYPFPLFRIPKRKGLDQYEAKANCKQFYVQLRKDFAMAQQIPADVEWKPSGNHLGANPFDSYEIKLSPLAVAIARAAEKHTQECLAYEPAGQLSA